MRRLFSSFERAGLEYLLISGQASVLYGAAMFSEDVDLWIRPTPANARKLLLALADQRARVHRLTPALVDDQLDFVSGIRDFGVVVHRGAVLGNSPGVRVFCVPLEQCIPRNPHPERVRGFLAPFLGATSERAF